jgi:hypothetical protein
MPKVEFAAAAAVLEDFLPVVLLPASLGATSVARSHDPFSWERATEKNKNT